MLVWKVPCLSMFAFCCFEPKATYGGSLFVPFGSQSLVLATMSSLEDGGVFIERSMCYT